MNKRVQEVTLGTLYVVDLPPENSTNHNWSSRVLKGEQDEDKEAA